MMSMTDDIKGSRSIIIKLEEEMKKCGMEIYIDETKVMRINVREIMKVKTKDRKMEQDDKNRYLGA